jgi:hypothetical protein
MGPPRVKHPPPDWTAGSVHPVDAHPEKGVEGDGEGRLAIQLVDRFFLVG